MSQAIAKILNKEVIKYYNQGMSSIEISKRLGVHERTVLSRISKIKK